jgi:hypothetical protein
MEGKNLPAAQKPRDSKTAEEQLGIVLPDAEVDVEVVRRELRELVEAHLRDPWEIGERLVTLVPAAVPGRDIGTKAKLTEEASLAGLSYSRAEKIRSTYLWWGAPVENPRERRFSFETYIEVRSKFNRVEDAREFLLGLLKKEAPTKAGTWPASTVKTRLDDYPVEKRRPPADKAAGSRTGAQKAARVVSDSKRLEAIRSATNDAENEARGLRTPQKAQLISMLSGARNLADALLAGMK